MTQRLAHKIAFVTAAGQGIGRAICEAFGAEGAQVIATDLDAGKLTPHAAQITIELRFAHCLDGCPTVSITWGDRLNQTQKRV